MLFRSVFSWEELRTGIDMALAQSAASVGDSVWRQAEGLPIDRGAAQPGVL